MALVKAQGQHPRIRKRAGDAVGLEQGRNLRLARDAVHALGDIEDEVPPVPLGEPFDQGAHIADAINVMAVRTDRARQAVYRVFLVEFGRFLE